MQWDNWFCMKIVLIIRRLSIFHSTEKTRKYQVLSSKFVDSFLCNFIYSYSYYICIVFWLDLQTVMSELDHWRSINVVGAPIVLVFFECCCRELSREFTTTSVFDLIFIAVVFLYLFSPLFKIVHRYRKASCPVLNYRLSLVCAKSSLIIAQCKTSTRKFIYNSRTWILFKNNSFLKPSIEHLRIIVWVHSVIVLSLRGNLLTDRFVCIFVHCINLMLLYV